jgi:hypothetical protein
VRSREEERRVLRGVLDPSHGLVTIARNQLLDFRRRVFREGDGVGGGDASGGAVDGGLDEEEDMLMRVYGVHVDEI